MMVVLVCKIYRRQFLLHKDAVAGGITGAVKRDAIKKSPCIVQEDFLW